MALQDYTESLQDAELMDLSSWPHWLKLAGVALLGLALVIGGYHLFYKPKQERLRKAQLREVTLKQQFQSKQRLAANLGAHEEQMIEIQKRFRSLLRQLPNQTEVPALLTDISQVGKERGLEFRRFKPLKTNNKEFYVELPIEIEASGTYHQLASFVSDIANFQRVVTVGDIQMQRLNVVGDTDLDVDDVVLMFKADLHTYHYNELTKEGGDQAGAQTQ